MEVVVKKVFFIFLIACFTFIFTANSDAVSKKNEAPSNAKLLEPYIATDEAEIEASGSRQRLEEEKEEQGASLDLENIEAGEAPNAAEFGTDDDF